MKKRVRKVLTIMLPAVVVGLAYGWFFMATGIGIPCIFRRITGLLCPGCGVTRMCVSLMKGDVTGAINSNALLFFTAPLFLLIFGEHLFGYIRTGQFKLKKWHNITLYIMVGMLIIFGITRNIFK